MNDPAYWGLIAREDGGYDDAEGGYHDTICDYIESEIFGMCGCGEDENKLPIAKKLLAACDTRAEWVVAQNQMTEIIKAEPEAVAHLLLHFLNKLEVMEHGGSVGGSWLTPLGEAIVDFEMDRPSEPD